MGVEHEFVGNTIASGDRLATQIGSSRPVFYLFGGEYDRKKLDEDVGKLTAYYRALGFFRARIGRELKFSENGKWVTIEFVIDEGQRYKVRNVTVIGNKKYTSQELLADLKLKNNEYFNQTSMTADVRSLQDKYGGVGYVFADDQARSEIPRRAGATRPGLQHQRRRPLPRRQDQHSHQGRIFAHAGEHGAKPPVLQARRHCRYSPGSRQRGGLEAIGVCSRAIPPRARPENQLQRARP